MNLVKVLMVLTLFFYINITLLNDY